MLIQNRQTIASSFNNYFSTVAENVRSYRGADCDSHHYLVVGKLRERLAVNKQAAQKFDGKDLIWGS